MKRLVNVLFLTVLLFSSCNRLPEATKSGGLPDIFPDYAEVTVPPNIAPLNFALTQPCSEAFAVLTRDEQKIVVKANKGRFTIPAGKWKKLVSVSGEEAVISVTVMAKNKEWISYSPFNIFVAKEKIDPYIAYRLIEPGYVLWNNMGIYQRNLENYSESAIMENKLTDKNCMNCHSFCMQNPDKMLFHMREKNPGTFIINNGTIEKLETKTDRTVSALVYPSWHPSGKYVAFSVNKTKQAFHRNDANRVEVYDEESDVVVYDIEKHEIITSSQVFSTESFETFPTFSPDGKTLYFCTAVAVNIPDEFNKVKYSLCSIQFDEQSRSFGTLVDTLYNAERSGQSASFPRVSPDGKYLLYTLSGYGNFSIWHKDADLQMFELSTKSSIPLDILNSEDVESYHSWSSNSRWVVFSSRRIDGLYTRPYIAHIAEDGKASKPFLLPQRDTDFYHRFMKSYNIPEFITGKVKVNSREVAIKARNESGLELKFSMK